MTSKWCFVHAVRVQDFDSKIPPIESDPIVMQFQVFSNDLPIITPEREIGFGIDLFPITNVFQLFLIGWLRQN